MGMHADRTDLDLLLPYTTDYSKCPATNGADIQTFFAFHFGQNFTSIGQRDPIFRQQIETGQIHGLPAVAIHFSPSRRVTSVFLRH